MIPWNTLSREEQKTFASQSNGCGTGSFIVKDLLYRRDCIIHDWDYTQVKTRKDRYVADLVFLASMIRRAVKKDKGCFGLWLDIFRARIYYSLVRMFGWVVIRRMRREAERGSSED